MNILSVFVLFAILLKCTAASGEDVGVEFREAVGKEDFGWLMIYWKNWEKRNDLLDYVIANGADFIVKLIQNVKDAKRRVLAALFDQEDKGMIDDVLGRIEYDDNDLGGLTDYRPELAGSSEKFFRVLDKIENPETQALVVYWGVLRSLLAARKRDLVAPLVNALGKRTFKNDHLKDEAIWSAFCVGANSNNQDIVELYYEHPAITSEEYADGLYDILELWQTKASLSVSIGAS